MSELKVFGSEQVQGRRERWLPGVGSVVFVPGEHAPWRAMPVQDSLAVIRRFLGESSGDDAVRE